MNSRKTSREKDAARVSALQDVEKASAPQKSASQESVSQESVSQESANKDSFRSLQLEAPILSVLDRLKFVTPTPIQRDAIPVVLGGEDIIGIAQTGTGKTLAFGLPILNRFVKNGNRSRGRALIVLPTRELALQVDESLKQVGKTFGLRTAVLIGGAPMKPQQQELRANPDIIVATPGRLIDHVQSRWIDLRTVETLVLDEADRMLDMGFLPQIKQILREVPPERQTLLFSATMPDGIVQIAANYMHQPVRVEVARSGSTADDVTQELFIVPQDEKNVLLSRLLYEYSGTVLIFTRTRSRASRVTRYLRQGDHSVAEIHADRTLLQRRAALDGFKNGNYRVLVATDIAARGIDVNDIELVLNYDLPDSAEDYVHRIGRTGRAGKSGHAISFAAPDQSTLMRDIEKLIEANVPLSEHSLYEFEAGARDSNRSRRGRGGPSRGPSGGSSSGQGSNRPPASRSGASPRSGSAPRAEYSSSSSSPRASTSRTASSQGEPRRASSRPSGRKFSGTSGAGRRTRSAR